MFSTCPSASRRASPSSASRIGASLCSGDGIVAASGSAPGSGFLGASVTSAARGGAPASGCTGAGAGAASAEGPAGALAVVGGGTGFGVSRCQR